MKNKFILIVFGVICLQSIFADLPVNNIFTAKPEGINFNLKNAYDRFKTFDLKNQASKQNFTQFKQTCRASLNEYKVNNSGPFAKKLFVQPQQGYDLPVTRKLIETQVAAAWEREGELQTEIKKIHQNYNSWPSIAAKTGMTFAFIGGYALINPFLPSCIQFKPESLQWVTPAAGVVIASLNGSRLWRMKNAQDDTLVKLKPEHQEVFYAAYNGSELLKIVDSAAKKK